jgi:hypothetical protein
MDEFDTLFSISMLHKKELLSHFDVTYFIESLQEHVRHDRYSPGRVFDALGKINELNTRYIAGEPIEILTIYNIIVGAAGEDNPIGLDSALTLVNPYIGLLKKSDASLLDKFMHGGYGDICIKPVKISSEVHKCTYMKDDDNWIDPLFDVIKLFNCLFDLKNTDTARVLAYAINVLTSVFKGDASGLRLTLDKEFRPGNYDKMIGRIDDVIHKNTNVVE